MDSISGYIEKIIFANEDNGWTVARLKEAGKWDLTTIVGNLLAVSPGESLELTGEWVSDKTYGRQFRVESYKSVVPASVSGIEKYLGSGLIPGIGPGMAGRLIAAFGARTLEIIDSDPERLFEVDGFGATRVARIKSAWDEQRGIREVMVFLQGHGISSAFAARIFKQYKSDSIAVVSKNPYQLATDISGIGFITADKIAQSLGIEPDSRYRIESGAIHTLGESSRDGHLYFPRGLLARKVRELLDVDEAKIQEAIGSLAEQGRIVLDPAIDPAAQTPDEAVYLERFYAAECGLADLLGKVLSSPSKVRKIKQGKAIEWAERQLGIKLAEMQAQAVLTAVSEKVSVITGGPGTGKSTIIHAVTKVLQALGLEVVLAAPTGRAAKRMAEITGREAKTIHRLLEFSFKQGGFQRDQGNPLEADVVILDEVSMIDCVLMYNLLKAVPPEASLVLVGDADQLPSVGPGNVLRDIIDSAAIKVVRLTEIFRQAQDSRIVTNAHRINRGEFPELPLGQEKSDFYFIEKEDQDEILRIVRDLCSIKIPQTFGLDPILDIQVLAPMYRGAVGITNLNAELQLLLNNSKRQVQRGGRTFKLRDKVLQLVNNYDKNVFNGDIGRVKQVDEENKALTVEFDGRDVEYDSSDLDEIVPAYAISIHKSQGCEYPAVVIPLVAEHYMMLQRNLIYTGVTRGKRLVVLVGSRKALCIALRNNKPRSRYTRLRDRLQQARATAL